VQYPHESRQSLVKGRNTFGENVTHECPASLSCCALRMMSSREAVLPNRLISSSSDSVELLTLLRAGGLTV